jgi:hypothetical protein
MWRRVWATPHRDRVLLRFIEYSASGSGAAAPRRQSLLRSFLAASLLPAATPPLDGLSPATRGSTIGASQFERLRSVDAVGAAQHVRGGTGREGARSEERAEQRLAPGGRRPPDPEQSITRTSGRCQNYCGINVSVSGNDPITRGCVDVCSFVSRFCAHIYASNIGPSSTDSNQRDTGHSM